MNETSADLTIEKVREYVTEVREGLITGEFYIDAAAYIRDCEFLLAQIDALATVIEADTALIKKYADANRKALAKIQVLQERIDKLHDERHAEARKNDELRERIASLEAASRMRGAARGEY